MSDDRSKYFPDAMELIERYRAEAVVVVVIGGVLGHGGAPALLFDMTPSREAGKHNRWILDTVVTSLRFMADNLERDVAMQGVPLEPKEKQS